MTSQIDTLNKILKKRQISCKLQIICQMACKSKIPNSFQSEIPINLHNREPNRPQNRIANRLYKSMPDNHEGGVLKK